MAKQYHDPSRRRALSALVFLPVALAGLAGAARAQTCYDPNTLPLSQRSRRRSLGFKDVSADPAKKCGLCAYFKATASTGCGTCQLLTGGVVSANSVCNSFAKKP